MANLSKQQQRELDNLKKEGTASISQESGLVAHYDALVEAGLATKEESDDNFVYTLVEQDYDPAKASYPNSQHFEFLTKMQGYTEVSRSLNKDELQKQRDELKDSGQNAVIERLVSGPGNPPVWCLLSKPASGTMSFSYNKLAKRINDTLRINGVTDEQKAAIREKAEELHTLVADIAKSATV